MGIDGVMKALKSKRLCSTLKDVVTKHKEEAKVYSVEVCPKAWHVILDLIVSKSISIVNVHGSGGLSFAAFVSPLLNPPLFFLLYIYAFMLYIPLWNISYFLFSRVELEGLRNNLIGCDHKRA